MVNLRDYDKRPIVIKDNSLLFVLIFVLPMLIVDFIYLLLGANRFLSAIIAFGIVAYILPYFKNKNYIVINSVSVKFLVNGNIIREIKLNEDFEIYKSFENLSKELKGARRYLTIPARIALYPLTIMSNFIFWLLFKRKVNYKFYEYIILKQKSVIISISPNTNYERALIRKFFKDNFNSDIEKAEKLLTFDWE